MSKLLYHQQIEEVAHIEKMYQWLEKDGLHTASGRVPESEGGTAQADEEEICFFNVILFLYLKVYFLCLLTRDLDELQRHLQSKIPILVKVYCTI